LSFTASPRLALRFGQAAGYVNEASHAVVRVELDAMVGNQTLEMDK